MYRIVKRLHNILTHAIMPTEISVQTFAIAKTRDEELYVAFRNTRFISKRLSTTIHRHQLKTFKSIWLHRIITQVERYDKSASIDHFQIC